MTLETLEELIFIAVIIIIIAWLAIFGIPRFSNWLWGVGL